MNQVSLKDIVKAIWWQKKRVIGEKDPFLFVSPILPLISPCFLPLKAVNTPGFLIYRLCALWYWWWRARCCGSPKRNPDPEFQWPSMRKNSRTQQRASSKEQNLLKQKYMLKGKVRATQGERVCPELSELLTFVVLKVGDVSSLSVLPSGLSACFSGHLVGRGLPKAIHFVSGLGFFLPQESLAWNEYRERPK